MYFYYDRYRLECMTIAILELPISLTVVITTICALAKGYKTQYLSEKLKLIGCLLISLMMVSMNIGSLLHGGFWLIQEKQTDSVYIKGDIKSIDELNIYQFPIMECDYVENRYFGDPTGFELNINGVRCTAPAKGDLKVGDYVEAEYLPKSGYILYIDMIEIE